MFGNTVSSGLSYNEMDYRIEGISAYMCPNTAITCNSTSNTGRGIFCSGPMFPTNIARNDMQNNIDGFLLNHGYIGPQGETGNPNDNRWIDTNFVHHTLSYFSNGNASPFYIRQDSGTTYHPLSMDNKVNPTGYIQYTPIKMVNTTGTSNLLCYYPANISLNLQEVKRVIMDSISFSDYNNQSQTINKYGLYKYLEDDTVSVSDSIVQQFIYDSKFGTFGNLRFIDEMLSKAYSDSGYQMEAESANDTISSNDTVVDAIKNVNTIYIDYLKEDKDSISFTETQLSDLQDMAQQCPYQHGPAVYTARVLLSLVDTTEYVNECEMATPEGNGNKLMRPTSSNPDKKDDQLFVYPNPSNDEVIFESNSKYSNGRIEIYEIMGNELFSIPLTDGSEKHVVSFKNYSSGIYYYRFVRDGNSIRSGKLLIIK
ncbi:MAG: T9SS type A sorting domain-containing protein [Bacteroidetes bacterium]|nr:T9SS type A sorting domain-containing protein [Bacteroidota bacterium]